MLRGGRLAAVLTAVAACTLLGACTTEPASDLLEAGELTALLLTAAETGLPQAVAGEPVEAGEGTMSLSTVMPDIQTEGPCAEAIRAGLHARFLPHASSSRLFTADAGSLEIGLFSTDTVVDAARIYGDIVTHCDRPVRDDAHHVTYDVTAVQGARPGMHVTATGDDGRTLDAVILQDFVGNNGVLAAGRQLSEDLVHRAFEAQLEKVRTATGL